jgi:hypothetical protein
MSDLPNTKGMGSIPQVQVVSDTHEIALTGGQTSCNRRLTPRTWSGSNWMARTCSTESRPTLAVPASARQPSDKMDDPRLSTLETLAEALGRHPKDLLQENRQRPNTNRLRSHSSAGRMIA